MKQPYRLPEIRTIHILGLISVCEILFSHKLESILLWIMYGVYRLIVDEW